MSSQFPFSGMLSFKVITEPKSGKSKFVMCPHDCDENSTLGVPFSTETLATQSTSTPSRFLIVIPSEPNLSPSEKTSLASPSLFPATIFCSPSASTTFSHALSGCEFTKLSSISPARKSCCNTNNPFPGSLES